MRDRFLDPRHFHYALASAEHGSFRRAAAALNVQQSTVSRGVRTLEHRVGAELFERGHSGIRPTPAGDRFLEEVTMSLDHLGRAMRRVGAMQRGEQGELAVAASVPFILMGDMFERFRDEHRGVSVEIVESTCSASCASVQQRKVDVAFVTRAPADGAWRSLHLCDELMIVVLPKSHALAEAGALMLEELRAEQFILSTRGMGPEVAHHLERCMTKSEGEPNIQSHRVGQCDLINMVARGFGVTVIVGRLAHAAPEGVVLVPLADMNMVPVLAVWMEANPNPALKGLLSILRGKATGWRSDTRSLDK